MEVTVPYWRKVWKTLASGSRKVPNDLITGLLDEVGDDLCRGIKVYETPFNQSECKSWLEKSELKDFDHTFERFFIRLCKSMNLKGQSAWCVLCNYLLYEFHGKLSRIKQLATYEPFATKLIEAIWHFYTSERMYLLKTLRFILEHFSNPIYAKVFPDYMKRVTWKFLWSNIVAQLDYLVGEIGHSTIENTVDLAAWVERNGQEQLEVVLIAITAMSFNNFTVDDFIPLLTVFMKSDFGRISPHACGIGFNIEVYDKICCAEIGAFLVFLDYCWIDDDFWLKKKDELDELVALASNGRGYQVIAFSWATLQAELCLNDGEEYKTRYSKQFDVLLNSGVMVLLYSFVARLRTFNCRPVKMVLKSFYNFMNSLCNAFNDDGFISLHQGTYEIMHELLKDDEMCANFILETDKPIYRLLEFSLKFFPFDFKGLTLLMLTFTEKGYKDRVTKTLSNLEVYAEDYFGRLRDGSSFFLRTDYFPIRNSKFFCIPEGTVANIFAKFKRTLILYEIKYDYYTTLISQLDALTLQTHGDGCYQQDTFQRVILGYKLMAAILQHGIMDIHSMRNFLKHYTRLYLLFSQGDFQHVGMMNVMLQGVEGAMFSGIRDDDKFWPLEFLPRLKHVSITKILNRYEVFHPSTLLDLLVVDEEDGSHPLLLAYGDFVKKAFEKQIFRKEVQLPGIVYLLIEVFPKYKDYCYSNPLDSYKVANMVLEIVWGVIKKDKRTLQDEEEIFIFDFCIEALLMDNYILKGYCEFFKTTLFTAQILLQKETNWEAKEDIVINKFVSLFLHSLLMLIKQNRYWKTQKNEASLFEQIVLHAPLERMNTVKVITAFADYSFDPEVQNLAIRILENMAMDPTYPMFGPMDLEPFQLQSFFLDKLRDPVEGDETKVAIIDFILTCVKCQPGLTNAFFNINILEADGVDDGESVVGCMMDFLENLEESKITVHHPLLRGILSVIHKVWDTGSRHLIQKITDLKNFWSSLVKPLYHELVADPKFYGYIFGILAEEILISKNKLNDDFCKVVRELFNAKNGFIEKWSEYLVNISMTITASTDIDQFDSVDYTGDIFVLYTWRLFIIYSQLLAPEFLKDPHLRMTITDACLDALLCHFKVLAEVPCIKIWSELYATCLSNWSIDSFTNVADLFTKTQKILCTLTVDYKNINASSKQAMLTAVAIMLKKFKNYAVANPTAVRDILDPLAKVMRYEFHELADHMQIAYKKEKDDMPDSVSTWLLVLSIANKVLLLENANEHYYWFEETSFLRKVLWCVGPFVQSPKTLPFAKFAMKSLIVYAQSSLASGLLQIDKSNFYKETVPPTEYVYPPLKIPLIMREWWFTYAEILKLMNFLIMKFSTTMTADVLTFVNFHDDTIIATLELARLTADPAALNLICCILMFCNNMLKWRGRWITNKENYFGRTVHAIKSCISGVCSLILRPKGLAFVSVSNFQNFLPNSGIPDDAYLDIYNMALEAITLGFSFFSKCQSPLLFYFDGPEYQYVVIELEKDFYIPKYNLFELNVFTYGGILCILHFLCKTYAKLHDHHRKKTEDKEERMLSRRTLKDVPSMEKLATLSETIDTPTKKLEPYLAVILTHTDADLVHDSISSVQRFASTCFSLFDMPWFLKLNPKLVGTTLETLSHFVVVEMSSDLHSSNISPQMKEYIKREMGSEMQFFHDFTRRNMQERLGSTKVDNTSPRKRVELEKLAVHINQLLSRKDGDFHDEYFWVLNHIVQCYCQLEDDN